MNKKHTRASWHSENIRFRDASVKCSGMGLLSSADFLDTALAVSLFAFWKLREGDLFKTLILSFDSEDNPPEIECRLRKKANENQKMKGLTTWTQATKICSTYLCSARHGGAIRTLTGVLATFWLFRGERVGNIECFPNWTFGKSPMPEYLLWCVALLSWKEELPFEAQLTTRLVNPGLFTLAYVLKWNVWLSGCKNKT